MIVGLVSAGCLFVVLIFSSPMNGIDSVVGREAPALTGISAFSAYSAYELSNRNLQLQNMIYNYPPRIFAYPKNELLCDLNRPGPNGMMQLLVVIVTPHNGYAVINHGIHGRLYCGARGRHCRPHARWSISAICEDGRIGSSTSHKRCTNMPPIYHMSISDILGWRGPDGEGNSNATARAQPQIAPH